jgi:hypothetical protein
VAAAVLLLPMSENEILESFVDGFIIIDIPILPQPTTQFCLDRLTVCGRYKYALHGLHEKNTTAFY